MPRLRVHPPITAECQLKFVLSGIDLDLRLSGAGSCAWPSRGCRPPARSCEGGTLEQKFTKSRSNRGTEDRGLGLLVFDRRFQAVDLATKRRILELLPVSGDFGHQTFDAVMTPEPRPPIGVENVSEYFDELRVVEMKTTVKPIRNAALNGFFFGATEREYEMARALGDKFLFAFVVLNADNDYGRPFATLLSLDEVEERTRAKRIQYQVNLRTDMAPPDDTSLLEARALIVFGEPTASL